MKASPIAILAFLAATLIPFCWSLPPGYGTNHPGLPQELNSVERQFLGKWVGGKERLKWEIDRKSDRTFEIVLEEIDPEDSSLTYQNYATGEWSVRGDSYYYEWKNWSGDEGDFSGIAIEKVLEVAGRRVVTLSDDDSKNTELKVESFKMPGWSLKNE